MFDNQDAQCQNGRKGICVVAMVIGCYGDYRAGDLCGECDDGYSVTLDLQNCSQTSCYVGLVLFVIISCEWVEFIDYGPSHFV